MSTSNRNRIRAVVTPLLVLGGAGCGAGEEAPRPLGQEGAHEHGVARVGLTVEGAQAVVTFRAPAAEVYGFEHAPSTEEERARRQEGLAKLETRMGEALVFDPSLGCVVGIRERGWDSGHSEPEDRDSHELDHQHDHDLEHDPADPGEHTDHDHVDVEAVFDVRCQAPLSGTRLQLALGEVLPGLVDVDLQVVGDRTFGGRYRASGTGVEL